MKIKDFQGKEITLSDESWQHIQDLHPEVSVEEIQQALSEPDEVRKSSKSDIAVLYYAIKSTPPKLRYRCVVVKNLENESFVVSAMTTSNMKSGETVYKKA